MLFICHFREDTPKRNHSLSGSRTDTIRGYQTGSGVFIVPDANRELYRKEDLQPENYFIDGSHSKSRSFYDSGLSYHKPDRSSDSYRRFDNLDSFESGWYPESLRNISYPDNPSLSVVRHSSSRSPYTSHGFAEQEDYRPKKQSVSRRQDIDDSNSDDNGFLPLRPPLPVGYSPTPIKRFQDPLYENGDFHRSYSRDQPSYMEDDVFSPHIPYEQKSGFPRHSSMKPASNQTYLTDDPILPDPPFHDISSVYPSPEHTYQNIPQQRPWHSFPSYPDQNRQKFYDDRLSHSLGYSPQKQVARVQPNNTSDEPRTYTRDHLQGTVDKLRRGPRQRKARSASRNSAPDFDRYDPPRQRGAYNSDSEAMRPTDFDRYGRSYSYNSEPIPNIPRGSFRSRHYPDSRSFRDDPTPDSLSSGIGSKNTSQGTGSTSGSRVPRPSLSYSSLLTPQDYSQDSAPFHDHSLHRDTSADDNYEFDTPDYDTLLAYPGGDELLSAIESGLSTSDFLNDLYPKPSKQSKYENSEQRFEKLRQEYHQYQRQQAELYQHHHFIDSEML